jgi:hypothetical protein
MVMKIQVRIFAGGKNGAQLNQFNAFRGELGLFINHQKQLTGIDLDISFEILKNKNVIEYDYGTNIEEPDDLVNWLIDSDIHFILCHVHQGSMGNLQWNMVDLENSLYRLENHVGFPSGIHLKDAMFLQHKYKYIASVGEISIPTFRVNLSETGVLSDEEINALYR